MTTQEEKASHLERTAAEPREKSLHAVTLSKIDQVNDQIRVFRLEVPREGAIIRFLPGQWLDVFVPGVPKAGGFTITSAPSLARWRTSSSSSSSSSSPPTTEEEAKEEEAQPGYLELAVQRSPDNPAAAWLWQQDADQDGSGKASIPGGELRVRVGGSFVWPPPGINARSLRKVVFVAGGVGVNPLMSMLSAIAERPKALDPSFEVEFMYSVRAPPDPNDRRADRILFLQRIASILATADDGGLKGRLRLFLTGVGEEEGTLPSGDGTEEEKGGIPFVGRRMTLDDVVGAVGSSPAERRFAVVYVCGVPAMTDEFVRELADPKGPVAMEPHRVLCEKWW